MERIKKCSCGGTMVRTNFTNMWFCLKCFEYEKDEHTKEIKREKLKWVENE